MTAIYPTKVCMACGDKAQPNKTKIFLTKTWQMDSCDVCNEEKPVTEPSGFSNPHFEREGGGNV